MCEHKILRISLTLFHTPHMTKRQSQKAGHVSLWKEIMAITPDGERRIYKLKPNGSLLEAMPRAPYRHRPSSAPQTIPYHPCDIPVEPVAFDEISSPDGLCPLEAWEERDALVP